MAFSDDPLVVTIEAAFGADRTQPAETWSWTDLTDRWHTPEPLEEREGRRENARQADPGEISLTLKNVDGQLTPDDPRSPWWPDVDEGLPMRVTVDPQLASGETVTWAGFVHSIVPRWPGGSRRQALVDVVVGGVLRQSGRGQAPLRDVLRRWVPRQPGATAYWPMDDGEDSVAARPAVGDWPLAPLLAQDQPAWAQGDLAQWLPPVAERRTEATMSGRVTMATSPGAWAVDHLRRDDGDGGPSQLHIIGNSLTPDGSRVEWVIDFTPAPTPLVDIAILHVGETTSSFTPVTPSIEEPRLFDDQTRHLRFETVLDGSDLLWALYLDGEEITTGSRSDSDHMGIGEVRTYYDPGSSQTARLVMGHLAVHAGTVPPAADAARAAAGHRGETAAGRVRRLCREESIGLDLELGEPSVLDTFDRTVVDGWGTAPNGETWSLEGGDSADYAVNGGTASVVVDATTSNRIASLEPDVADGEIAARVRLEPGTSLDDDFEINVGLRYSPGATADDETMYQATFLMRADGTVALLISRMDGGSHTALTGVAEVGTWSDGQWWWVRARVLGTSLAARAWPDGSSEPAGWQQTVADDGLTEAGRIVALKLRAGGNETPPVTVEVDQVHAHPVDLSTPMGPQHPARLVDLLRECEQADDGILAEDEFGFRYRSRQARYNRDHALTIDASNRELGRDLEPVRDDQRTRNEWTVRRRGGGEASAADEADQRRRGEREGSTEVNVASDLLLPDRAYWELSRSTHRGMRYPELSIPLHSAPQLVADILGVEVGDRIEAVNLPEQHPVDRLDQVVEGMRHTIHGRRRWVWSAIVAPASPWVVGVYVDPETTPAPDAPSRYDTAGTVVENAFAAGTDTVLTVRTTVGADPWTEDADDLPLDVSASGVRLRVTAVGPPDGSLVQTMTVQQQSLNGADGRTVPADADVRLWTPARYAL